MERSLIRQVNRKNMSARLNTRHVRPVYFPNFFGVVQKTSLKWETLVGEKGAPVIADIISYDASAPQKKREVIGKMSGDIPKTAIKRGMNESDWNEYQQLNNDADNASLQSLLDLAFKDQDFCYNGVRGRFEWWCMQLMSKAGFSLSSKNNNGIVTEEFVGCGMPASNRKVATTDWGNAATADGLQDIDDVVNAAASDGVSISYIIMRTNDFNLLKKQKSTADHIKGWINNTSKLTVTQKVINDYLEDQYNRPVTIVTIQPAVRIEDEAHNRKTINPWENHRITFLSDLQVGNIQHGPIAAENSAAYNKKAITLKKDFVFISKWSELEPFKEWTKAEANAIPVVDDPDTLYILKSDATAWDDKENTAGTDIVPAGKGPGVSPEDENDTDK
jgi:hypothetical protein